MAKRDESVQQTLDQVPDEKIYLESEDPWAPKVLDLEGTLVLLGMIGDIIDEIGGGTLAKGEIRFGKLIRGIKKELLLALVALATKQSPSWVEENFSFLEATKALTGFWKMNQIGELLGEVGLGLGGGTATEEEEEEADEEET